MALSVGVGLDNDTAAAKNFYKAVRNFALRQQAWQPAIWYETKPDEIYNAPLISSRVYGNFNESLAVMASAGIGTSDEPILQQQLCLPTVAQLYYLKQITNFESDPGLRNNFDPAWTLMVGGIPASVAAFNGITG